VSLPRARGFTHEHSGHREREEDSPACARVHPRATCVAVSVPSLSRVRAGSPHPVTVPVASATSLPRARGFTHGRADGLSGRQVSPAYARVHPLRRRCLRSTTRLSRVRAGSPQDAVVVPIYWTSLPRARGFTRLHHLARLGVLVSPACARVHPRPTFGICPLIGLSRVRAGSPQFMIAATCARAIVVMI
jgi:hypothetical protein